MQRKTVKPRAEKVKEQARMSNKKVKGKENERNVKEKYHGTKGNKHKLGTVDKTDTDN